MYLKYILFYIFLLCISDHIILFLTLELLTCIYILIAISDVIILSILLHCYIDQ